MALTRPLKEGSVTTYQQKVALGFKDILASEADGDHDTMYAAWNAGVDTVNIKDGVVTTAKLAAAPNGVATANLNNLAVTLGKLAARATIANLQSVSGPANFNTAGTGWKTAITLPAITTRGGLVVVIGAFGWSYVGNQATNIIYTRGWVDGTVGLGQARWEVGYGFTGGAQFPLPPVIYFDNPAAGSHTYALQVQVTTTAGNVVFQGDSPGMAHVLELA